MTVNFTSGVLGFGFNLIDLYNPDGVNAATLSAYTGADGTGTLLGTFGMAPYNFQLNHEYFIGVTSSDGDIGSVIFTTPGEAGDSVYLDDFEIANAAAAPEPFAGLLVGGGIAAIWLRRRRR